jgi:hypothetical protein
MSSTDEYEGKKILRQPRFYWITGTALIVFGVAVEVGIALQTPTFNLFDLVNPALLALLIGSGIVLSARNSIALYDDFGVTYQNLFRKRKQVLWSQSLPISYDEKASTLWIASNTERIPITSSRRGFGEFLDFVRQRATTTNGSIQTSQNKMILGFPTGHRQSAPQSWISMIAGAILVVVTLWANYVRDPAFVGFFLLGMSILFAIVGGVLAFNKKERAISRKLGAIQEPAFAASLEAPDADRIQQRRGYITLLAALLLFLLWSWFYGFSSLALGV